jgi:cbb3-type cytochrome oxidase maturation protein
VDILYLLIPFSALLVLAILALFAWALRAGQFDDLDREGERILDPTLDADQAAAPDGPEQSAPVASPCSNRRGGDR